MKNAAEEMRSRLPNGIPEMHIPSLDPMHIPHAELDTGASFKAVFDDIRIYGLSDFVLKSVKIDIKDNVIDVDLLFPLITAIADYNMKGRILILQLNGVGKAAGNYSKLLCVQKKTLAFKHFFCSEFTNARCSFWPQSYEKGKGAY